jgi:hypothetical protein
MLSVQISSNDLDGPICRRRFFHLLGQVYPQHAPTRQGHLELSRGTDYRRVSVRFYPFKTTQMTMTDLFFYFDLLSPIGAGAPSGLFKWAREP